SHGSDAPGTPGTPGTSAAPGPAPAPAPVAAQELRLAASFRAQGNHIKELYHLSQAVRLDPKNRRALFLLGQALIADGQKDLGCAKLSRALPDKDAQSLYEETGCRPVH